MGRFRISNHVCNKKTNQVLSDSSDGLISIEVDIKDLGSSDNILTPRTVFVLFMVTGYVSIFFNVPTCVIMDGRIGIFENI